MKIVPASHVDHVSALHMAYLEQRFAGRTGAFVEQLTLPEGDPCVLYTAFGGPAAPREPGDPTLDAAGRAESEAFWAAHALSDTDR